MLSFLPITELAKLIKARKISPVEIVQELLTRTKQSNPQLNSYITVCAELVLNAARQAEAEIQEGHYRGALHGIPVSHKDLSWTKGVHTTAHSKTLLDFIPETNATHVERLEKAGMILLGKTNTTEFACGDMHLFGKSCNPWNLTRSSGASSGGSANAVAAGLAVAATGTDTGGSTRVPASFCGVVGVKPTFGRVSRYGVFPLSYTMDSVGPITRTVADAALMLGAMSGYDSLDPSTSHEIVPDFTSSLHQGIKGLVLGVPEHYFFEGLEPAVAKAMEEALKQLESLGAKLQTVRLPMAADLSAAANILVMGEAFSQHASRLREKAQVYGPKARRRICSGAFFSAAEFLQAGQIRTLWIRELEQVMNRVDALITPTLPFTAFSVETWEDNPPDTSWATRHFNLSGHPAMTVPCGFDEQALPIGLQIVANAFDEVTMFRVGHAYEQTTKWYERRPVLFGGNHV
jgi:aspartyl-tRNA(Asn)/glutamyl-tRNA(Gln) amidotransferase subunit A